MEYETFFKIEIETKEVINLGKALKLYNSENDIELSSIERTKGICTIRVRSKKYLIGYETYFIAFKFGQVYRDIVLML